MLKSLLECHPSPSDTGASDCLFLVGFFYYCGSNMHLPKEDGILRLRQVLCRSFSLSLHFSFNFLTSRYVLPWLTNPSKANDTKTCCLRQMFIFAAPSYATLVLHMEPSRSQTEVGERSLEPQDRFVSLYPLSLAPPLAFPIITHLIILLFLFFLADDSREISSWFILWSTVMQTRHNESK